MKLKKITRKVLSLEIMKEKKKCRVNMQETMFERKKIKETGIKSEKKESIRKARNEIRYNKNFSQ